MKGYHKLLILILSFSLMTVLLIFNASAASPVYGTGTVAASALNVRTEGSTSAPVSATVNQGDTVIILDKPGDSWYHVNCGGTVGFVAAQYISGVQTAGNVSIEGTLTGSAVRMRSTPSTEGDVIGTYSNGTVMSIIGIDNGWYQVQYDGTTGYIRSDLISIAKKSDAPSGSIREKIAEYAKQFVGYSYVYGAASPKVGFDCSGLTSYVYNQFGIPISRTARQQYKNNGVVVSKENLQPGDLVFFSSNGGRSITHVGLYIGGDKFVNASTPSVGVIISSLSSAYYQRVWYGAKQIIN